MTTVQATTVRLTLTDEQATTIRVALLNREETARRNVEELASLRHAAETPSALDLVAYWTNMAAEAADAYAAVLASSLKAPH